MCILIFSPRKWFLIIWIKWDKLNTLADFKRPYIQKKIRYRTLKERDVKKIETYVHLVDRDIVGIIGKKNLLSKKNGSLNLTKNAKKKKMFFSGNDGKYVDPSGDKALMHGLAAQGNC